MTPQARVQAAIEVLDLVIDAARRGGAPADRIISDWFRTRRFAGSGDRRAVRDLAYAAIRACGEIPANGRAAVVLLASGNAALAGLFDGSRHAPEPIAADEPLAEAGIAPRWLAEALSASGVSASNAAALLDRAPLDIRVNSLKADRATLDLPLAGEPLLAPQGLRLPHGTNVESWDAYQAGQIEVQDGGSQLTCLAVAAQPGETVIDLCAGAGGKTLALAAAMDGQGRLIACDTDRTRLSRLTPRAERAGVSNIEVRLLDPQRETALLTDLAGQADAVLVDAPCSGTGTWRRNPEARWRLSPQEVARYAAVQSRLLDIAAGLVRPGGRLVFVTCSLLDAEGANQIDAFLARQPGWRAEAPGIGAGNPRGSGLRLSPWDDGTDGFFVARLLKL
ncbi:RsmB/NOP family class I SAM-dependent RNA methyltransferase [Novosphingobium sp.]|uniref:RsmB/NOP family class I SAM-dependent RNA methyltransferase n=1 Tax=Novosphingobium sp. TaxID=1874826 RepID=UPI0027347B8E|nr:RsmB/NOP family class I SAM-dependent RNA methyltransferase [Novosphingobium sp.]MDP3908029.1 RsmB/NOP family class I SAM-dependent RNA methyltransferase [Novosphingobium sp.]